MNIVVVGAGQAGASLVAKLRTLGHTGAVTMVGTEPSLPYQRPPLSKGYLLGEIRKERLLLRPGSFYTDQDIHVLPGTTVTAINRAEKTLTLSDGGMLSYDALALTTGATPRRLPETIGGVLQGVYTVRTLADVDAMSAEFVPARHVLIVGGGYIGLEAAAVAAKKGLRVTVLEAADRILSRVASSATADYFRTLHQTHGVDLREGVALSALIGVDRVTGAQLSDGAELAVDFAIVGIGVTPNTHLAAGAGLAVENGILVDALCRTSDPSIFAAGDCAAFPHRGQQIRLESVPNAIEQAEAAAAIMLGGTVPYQAKPWFWSDQYETKLQIAGLNMGYDRTVTRPGDRAGAQSVWYYAGPRLIAVDAMNDPRAYMTGKRLIEAGLSPDETLIPDRSVPLKELAARSQQNA